MSVVILLAMNLSGILLIGVVEMSKLSDVKVSKEMLDTAECAELYVSGTDVLLCGGVGDRASVAAFVEAAVEDLPSGMVVDIQICRVTSDQVNCLVAAGDIDEELDKLIAEDRLHGIC